MKKKFLKLFVITAALILMSCVAALTDGGTAGFSAMADGDMPALNVQLTSDTVTRGDFLEIRVVNYTDYDQYADFGEYDIKAYVSSESWWGDTYQCNRWGYIRIPTQNIDPAELLSAQDNGEFTVTIEAHDDQNNRVSAEKKFKVIEPAWGNLYFTVTASEAVTGETYYITAYAPGAYRIDIYDTYEDIKFSTDPIYDYNEDPAPGRGKWADGYNFRDKFSYYGKAYFYDEDTGTEFTKVSSTRWVNVTADSDVPVIDVQMNQVLSAGEDIVFQIPDTGTTGWSNWNLRVLRRSDRQGIIHNYRSNYEVTHASLIPGQPYEIRIPTTWVSTDCDDQGNPHETTHYYLEPGEAYNVELGFFQYNKHGYSFDVPILVLGEDTVTDTISMTVNGKTGTIHAAAHQDMSYHVQGPASATGLLVFEGNDWRFHEGNEWTSDWGWWTLSHIQEYLFYAKYTTDPIPDTEYDWHDFTYSDTVSNVVRLINDTQGYLPVPEFTLNTTGSGEVGEITRGDWLEATITNLDDYSGCENVSFSAVVYDTHTGEGFGGRFYENGTGIIRIPTAGIDPENRLEFFTIDVRAEAEIGWYQSIGTARFNVVEPAEQSAVFSVWPADVITGEDYSLSLYAPGAVEYRIFENGNPDAWNEGNGGIMTETRHEDNSGFRVYEAKVRYENSSDWTPVGSVTVNITAPNGSLSGLMLNAPSFLDEGEDLVLSWDGIDSVDGVGLYVWRSSDGERVWHTWGEQKSFTVSAIQPNQAYHMEQLQQPGEPVLEVGTQYDFSLVISKRGYEGTELQGSVYILSGNEVQAQGDLTLKLNGSDDFIQEFLTESSVTITVEAPEATGIRVIDPNRLGGRVEPDEDDWQYFDHNGLHNYLEFTYRFNPNARRIQAQARYDEYEDIRDLNNGENPWTAVSNDILLGIQSTVQQMPAPVVSQSASSVTRGDWINFTVTPAENLDEWYWAELGRQNVDNPGSIQWLDHYNFNSANRLSINTVSYEAGTYCLNVYNMAVGYVHPGEARLYFEIAENGSAGGCLSISSAASAPDDSIFICAYAPDINRMRLEITQDGNPGFFDWREWDGGEYAVQDTWSAGSPGTYFFDLFDKVSGERIGTRCTLTVTAGSGPLSKPNLFALPGSIDLGQSFVGAFTIDSRAEWVDINIEYIPDDGSPWQRIYNNSRSKEIENRTSLNLPAVMLNRVGTYRINVHTHATGYQDSNSQTSFIVKSAGSINAVALTVNGSTADIPDWPSSANLHFVAQAQGATAFRLLRQDNWWDYRSVRNGRAEWDLGFGDGDYNFVAQMTTDNPVWDEENFNWDNFNWDDLSWTSLSNIIKVHVSSQGALLNPAITVNPADGTVTRGDILTVTVAEQPHVDWAWAELRVLRTDSDDNRWLENVRDGHFDSNGNNLTLTIPTYPFEPGSYFLEVGIESEGWEGRSTFVPVTIEAPDEPILPNLVFSSDTMLVNDGIQVYAWAPGASMMKLEVTMEGDSGFRNDWGTGRDNEHWNWGCGRSGTYYFKLLYWMPDHAGPDDDPTGAITKALNVTSTGNLNEPVFSNVPGVISLGAGISDGSFSAISGAEWYNVGIQYSDDGWHWEDIVNEDRRASAENATALAFGSDIFSHIGTYRLWVSANAIGKNNGNCEIRIEVIDPQTVTGALSLKVDGKTNGADVEIYLHQEKPVTITVPGGVTAVRLRSSSQNGWEVRAITNSNTEEWYWGFHNRGPDTLIAQATTDPSITAWLSEHDGMWDFDWSEINWSMTSNAVTVDVIKFGNLDAPQVEFTSTAVERGDPIELTIHPVQNAFSYGVQIRRADDNEWRWIIDMDYPLTAVTAIQVPTDILAPGEYMLHIDPRNIGWHGDSRGYPITVTAPSSWSNEPFFRVSSLTPQTLEPLTFSVYAPGAEEIKVCNGSEENDWLHSNGETLVGYTKMYWVGEIHFLAFARYPDQENWVQIGNTQDVNIIATKGALGLTVSIPESIHPNEDLNVTLTPDFLDTTGTMECWIRKIDGRDTPLDFVSKDNNGHYTYQVPANTLDIGVYFLFFYAVPDEPGYEIGVEERQLLVVEEELPATLTVAPNQLEIFENYHISLHAPGATAVAIWSEGIGWQYKAGDSMGWDDTAWWDGEDVIYGKYTTDDIDPDDPDFAWETVHWTGVTNTVSVTINEPSDELEELNVALNKTTVKRGEQLILTINNVNSGLDVSYGAHLQPLSDQVDYVNGFTWFGPDQDEPKIIRIETLEVEPGSYQLQVSANAVSCHPVNTWLNITVTDPDTGVQMTVYPNKNVLTGNMVQVVGYASGATHLDLEVSSENGVWEPQPGYASCNVDGDLLNTEVFMGEHPDTVILDLTATFENGTTQTIRKTIPVAAPNGSVHPVIQLSSNWMLGRDLDFTVQIEQDAQYVVFVQEPDADEALFATFVSPGHPVTRYQLSQIEYGFLPGTTYEIKVIAAGTGYNGSEAAIQIIPETATTVLNLPAGLRTIEDEAFAGVAAEKIVVPSGVTAIGSKAFADSPNLIELDLPQGITSFAPDALLRSGPVFIYGPSGSYLEVYADAVDNLYFIPTN